MLTTGYAAPLPWLPMPVIGRGLNSGGPSWDCSAGFMRWRQNGLGAEGSYGAGNADVIARALGLEELAEAEMIAQARTTLPDALARSIGDHLATSRQNLEGIIRDPSVRLTYHDIKGLHQRIDLWRDRVPDMLDALERAFDGGSKSRERATMLQDLLLKLDKEAYATVNQRILAALTARPALDQDFVRGPTLSRLGELGPPAVPILERYFFQHGRPGVDAMLGLCKAGTAASGVADRLVREVSKLIGFERDRRFAAYLTLHRIGAAAHAGDVLGEKHRIPENLLRRIAQTVTPASPTSDCISYSKWHDRLRRERSRTR